METNEPYVFMSKELEERFNEMPMGVKKSAFSILMKNLIESQRKLNEENLKKLREKYDGENPFGSAPV